MRSAKRTSKLKLFVVFVVHYQRQIRSKKSKLKRKSFSAAGERFVRFPTAETTRKEWHEKCQENLKIKIIFVVFVVHYQM